MLVNNSQIFGVIIYCKNNKIVSKTIYKIEFEYDDNCGNCYQPLSKYICYEIINNCNDYEEVVDEYGDYVELRGSDSFIENLIF